MRRSLILIGLAMAVAPTSASAIPAFARRYGVSCAQCHAPVPRLNKFGQDFANNGFRFSPDEDPRDTLATGDALLQLQRSLPLAVRFDTYATGLTHRHNGQSASDLETPWVVKLLSGGPISDKVSYYTYFLLTERGEVAGLEDAYVQFMDVLGTKASVLVGQFQVSDPMFKRELRLSLEDYQLYRARMGQSSADLTYDRGITVLASPWSGSQLSVQVLNGRGLQAATDQRQFDRDGQKNLALRYSQDIGALRLGGFAYRGVERAQNGTEHNTVEMIGPDATLPLGSFGELNAQYLRRRDKNPFFGQCSVAAPCPGGATEPYATTLDAAMAEATVWPAGASGRVFVTATYNWLHANRPALSLRLGEQNVGEGYLQRYQSLTGGLHFLYRRNVRLMTELGYDIERSQARLIAGTILAF